MLVWHWELQCMPLVGMCTIIAETMRSKCVSATNTTAHSDTIQLQSKIPSESYLIMRSEKDVLIQYKTVTGQLEIACAFVCLFVRKQDYTNPTELIYVKCDGGEGKDPRKIPLIVEQIQIMGGSRNFFSLSLTWPGSSLLVWMWNQMAGRTTTHPNKIGFHSGK